MSRGSLKLYAGQLAEAGGVPGCIPECNLFAAAKCTCDRVFSCGHFKMHISKMQLQSFWDWILKVFLLKTIYFLQKVGELQCSCILGALQLHFLKALWKYRKLQITS